MSNRILDERRESLEDQFFAKQESKIKQQHRELKDKTDRMEALKEASGITGLDVLERLYKAGVEAETLTALTMVPMVEVAWADQSMQITERQAILDLAAKVGIEPGSANAELLNGWLQEKPPRKLVKAWEAYVAGLVESLDDEEKEALRNGILTGARHVAESAGGMLGIGRISKEEKHVMERLEAAFGD